MEKRVQPEREGGRVPQSSRRSQKGDQGNASRLGILQGGTIEKRSQGGAGRSGSKGGTRSAGSQGGAGSSGSQGGSGSASSQGGFGST
ncbi:hypothetical protein QQF64_028722 [Cirrhinus molitorella]|uniref:Uncharacterized protein n=1 Tax=Cirrhinus molitorella TaxID=172907 RepID=A0ABR3N817_9TELE